MQLPKIGDTFEVRRSDGHVRFTLEITSIDRVYVHSRITSGKGGSLATPHADFDRYVRTGVLVNAALSQSSGGEGV